jgi:hypothetical protein
MSILQKYLNKLGLQSYAELNGEEKETYKQWEESIAGRKLTDEDVKIFLETELQTAIGRLTDINLSKEDEVFRKVEVKFIQKVLKFLDGPRVEKIMMEKQIESRIG